MNEETLRTNTERVILHGVIRAACKHNKMETDVNGMIVSVCTLNSKPSAGGTWIACDLDCPMLKMYDNAMSVQAMKELEEFKERQQQMEQQQMEQQEETK